MIYIFCYFFQMSTNAHVLPLLPSVMSLLNVRTFVGLIATDANLIHISGNGKTCKGLWSVERRDSSVVSSQKGVTLLCEFSLLGDKFFLLRSNSTGNLIQRPKISYNMQKVCQRRCYNTEHTSNPCKFRSRKHVQKPIFSC